MMFDSGMFLLSFDRFHWLKTPGLILGGGALVFKGGHHAQVQKHAKRVVFHGEARAARPRV